MKIATLRTAEGVTAAARLEGDAYREIEGFSDVGALLGDEAWQQLAEEASGWAHPAGAAVLAPVVPRPSKILCVGLNYRSHILEMGRELPAHPTLFAKFADTLTGPNDPVEAVVEDPAMDWEGELAIVIGRLAYRVAEEDAPQHIAGYTIANDISMRSWQSRTQEWLQGKIWASSTPIGPAMVTSDEFDPADATIRTTVNGDTMQEHATHDLLFTPAHLVSYISTILPLRPGDLILTGTPGGVGHARSPKVRLAAGDLVEVSIDGIGMLSTRITAPEQTGASPR